MCILFIFLPLLVVTTLKRQCHCHCCITLGSIHLHFILTCIFSILTFEHFVHLYVYSVILSLKMLLSDVISKVWGPYNKDNFTHTRTLK